VPKPSRHPQLLAWALQLWAAGCQDARQPDAAEQARAPAVAHVPPAALRTELPQLGELTRARLAYMFEAAALVRASWPLMTPERTCVMLIDAERQWVVNCDVAPAGFVRTTEQLRDRSVYVHEGGTFESAGSRRSTAELLAATPAAAHVRPAQGEAAAGLPGDDPWLVLGTLEALSAFHPAFGPATTEAWVSVAMHEFVHTHQLRAPEFAPYLATIARAERTSAALDHVYASSPEYRALVAGEYALLSAAAAHDADDRTAALRALRSWQTQYRKRSQFLTRRADAAHLLEDDALFSYLEGVARFVESDFLANRAQHPQANQLHDVRFHAYDQFLDRGYAGSPNRQLDTQYVYAIGYHLCILLERIDATWKTSVHTRSHWLYGSVEHLAAEGGGG
jgi:hypothetical protein